MAAQPIPRLSLEEFLAIEPESETKHEYYAGQIYDMAGGTLAHARIAGNLIVELGSRLRGKCAAYPSDLLVRTAPGGLYTYPDVVIVLRRCRRRVR